MTTDTTPITQPGAPAPEKKPGWLRRHRKHVIGYVATYIIASVIAGNGSSSDTATAAAQPVPTSTVTATVTAGAGATVSVPVPGPTVTVTKNVISPKPAKTVTVKVTPEPQTAMGGDGTYEVGVDVKPGTYVSKAPDGNCYWARLSSGNTSDIIDNNNSTGQSLATIKSSDKFFETNGCSDWVKR